jgi:putative tricarboxylic transport membrane protein
VLAMVIGDKAEDAFRQSMIIHGGSLGAFWSNWLCGTIMTLGFVLLLWPLVSSALQRTKSPPASTGG